MKEPEKQETVLDIPVPPGYRGAERLDVYVTRSIENASRAKVQKAIRDGMVSVSGVVVTRGSHVVQAGERIECRVMRPPPIEVAPEPIPLSIVFEDDHLIVLDKPAGLVVHPAYGNRTGTLVNALLYHVGAGPIALDDDADDDGEEPDVEGLSGVNAVPRYSGDPAIRPGIVHRLDKDTSGLMVVAKDDVTHRRLAKQFADRTIRRRYEAIAWGHFDPPEGRVEAAIGRDPRDRKRMAVVKGAKFAATRYETLERLEYTSRVAFRLETGRTHQIRVHSRFLGHPIVGDSTYGGDRIALGPDTQRRRAYWRNLFALMPRQALHAATLGFRHPATGEDLDFEATLPADMAEVLKRLRSGDPG